jgi:ketosteroid isomerase-like protein
LTHFVMNKLFLKEEIRETLNVWYPAWNEHNLGEVIDLFHDKAIFIHWTGAIIKGKKALRRAWNPWFENNGGFRFVEEDTFIDEAEQKALFRWKLEWPSPDGKYKDKLEIREGVDIIHFKDKKIIMKLTYSKNQIEIDDKKISL